METIKPIPLLDSVEIRVLGSLIEKSKTTPDYYPMTLNAITLACNQKSSRKPLVQYEEEIVISALDSLKKKGLVATSTGGGSRTIKYKQTFELEFNFSQAELTVLCLLFLRGPLTPGEINSNSGRLHQFASIQSVLEVLEKLGAGEPPVVKLLPRKAGQKETRFVHLFGEIQEWESGHQQDSPEEKPNANLELRIEILEKEMTELKAEVEKLKKEWLG